MARVKKGLNARKKHKKILKLAKGFYGQKSKVFRAANPAVTEIPQFCLCRKKEQEKRIQKTLDRKNQCRRKNERHFLQQADEWPEGFRNRNQQKDAFAEMAIYDPAGFAQLAETAKKAVK